MSILTAAEAESIERQRTVRVRGTGQLLWCRCKRGPSGTVHDGYRDPDCIFEDTEILYDGPAGSSKTFSDCVRAHWICSRYPARILFLRETFSSHAESIKPIMEEHVLGPHHELLEQGGSRENRTHYDYKKTGAHIRYGGIDRLYLYLSSEWDIVDFYEAQNPRIRESHWAEIGTRMRGTNIPHPHCQYPDGVMPDGMTTRQAMIEGRFEERDVKLPNGRSRHVMKGEDDYGCPLFFRQRVGECNPSIIEGDQHWLMQRFLAGKMTRLFAQHADNPMIDESYLKELRELPEPYRSAYYEGKWTVAEGLCWPTYRPKRHLIYGSFERDPSTGTRTVEVGDWLDDHGRPKRFPIQSVTAGFDWGIERSGSLQVVAYSGKGADKIAFRIAEVHHNGESLDWWAEQVVAAVDAFRIEAILCDPSARAIWEMFNLRLGKRQGRDVGGICQAGTNTRITHDWMLGGIDLVRVMFGRDRLFLFDNCHMTPPGVDPKLKMKKRPVGLHEEIPGYRFARDKTDNDRVLPEPDKVCFKDGCDALRYDLMDGFQTERDIKPKPLRTFSELSPYTALKGSEEAAMRRRQEIDGDGMSRRTRW